MRKYLKHQGFVMISPITKIIPDKPAYFSRNQTSNLLSFFVLHFTPYSNESVYFFLQESNSFNS